MIIVHWRPDEVLTCFGVVMMVGVRTVSGVTRCCMLEDEVEPTPTPPPLTPSSHNFIHQPRSFSIKKINIKKAGLKRKSALKIQTLISDQSNHFLGVIARSRFLEPHPIAVLGNFVELFSQATSGQSGFF